LNLLQATRVAVELTELGKLDSYRTIFYWFTSLVFVILPLILLIVFNSFLVLAVHRSQRQRRQLTQVRISLFDTFSTAAES
jgi:hypothetical protein